MTRCDLASGSGCNRRQGDEQQPLQNSIFGKVDSVFLLRSLESSDGRGREGLRSKQRTCLYNDAVWCVRSRLSNFVHHLPDRPPEVTICE